MCVRVGWGLFMSPNRRREAVPRRAGRRAEAVMVGRLEGQGGGGLAAFRLASTWTDTHGSDIGEAVRLSAGTTSSRTRGIPRLSITGPYGIHSNTTVRPIRGYRRRKGETLSTAQWHEK